MMPLKLEKARDFRGQELKDESGDSASELVKQRHGYFYLGRQQQFHM